MIKVTKFIVEKSESEEQISDNLMNAHSGQRLVGIGGDWYNTLEEANKVLERLIESGEFQGPLKVFKFVQIVEEE